MSNVLSIPYMMTETHSLAIQVLEQKIEEIEREAEAQKSELRANIARLRGERPSRETTPHAPSMRSNHPPVRAGQFSGMNRKSALQAYLNERQGPVLVTKAAVELISGGAPMGKDPKRYRRYLRTTITQNPSTFHYDENSDTVSLRQPGANERRGTSRKAVSG